MKPRFLDAMGEALTLVRTSNLAEATALIRKALSGEESTGGESEPEAGERARVEAPAFGRNSSLAEATALPREALLSEGARGRKSEPEAEPGRPPASALARPARRPLGEVLRALRDRPVLLPGAPAAPGAEPAHDFGDQFSEAHLSRRRGRPQLPALCSGRSRAARPRAGAHAAWMHAKSGRFRVGNADERPCRRVRPHRRLSPPDAAREPVRLLELVRPAASAPRVWRTGQARRPRAGAGARVRRREGSRFRRRPVGGRRDGGGSRRNLPGCLRRRRDSLRPAL